MEPPWRLRMDQRLLFLIIGIVVVVAIGLGVWAYLKQRRRKMLRSRFGPEYDRTVVQMHDRNRAEAELLRREKRVQKFQLRALPSSEQQGFLSAWKAAQTRFVDDPRDAVTEADRLLRDVMRARGYPEGDFE